MFYKLCDHIYIKYKNKQNKFMLLEVKIEVILGRGRGAVQVVTKREYEWSFLGF